MNKLIGEELNALRIKHGLTQQQLSDLSGIPLGTVKTILSGATPNPGYPNVCNLLYAMEESSDDFFCALTDRVPTSKVPAQPEIPPIPTPAIPKIDVSADVHKATTEAINNVLYAEYVQSLRHDLRFWRVIALILALAFVGWLLWDIRHPYHGLVHYGDLLQSLGIILRL